MIIEQRPPHEVFVSPHPEQAEQQIYQAGSKLMVAASTNRPYAGLILRNGIPKDHAAAMQNPDRAVWEPAIHQTDYLDPLNAAIQDVWAAQPPHTGFTPGNLTFHHEVIQPFTEPHTDQMISTLVKPEVPLLGPVTAIGTAFGHVNYNLWVYPVNAFDPEQHEDFDIAIHSTDSLLPKLTRHNITAGPGDVLALTNLPPTIHMARSSERRLSIVCLSQLESNNPVE